MVRLILLLIFFSTFSYSQDKTSELGLFAGGSFYLGDLNSQPFKFTKPAGGILFRYIINKRYAIKVGGLYGHVAAEDSRSNNAYQQQRNLSFKSSVLDVSGQIEFNFFPYETGHETKRFSPYVFIGLGMFHFSPSAKLGDEWYDLQPLGTEGQGSIAYKTKKYSLTQFSMPFGLGIKQSLSKRVAIGAEWGMRATSTDYLDDVSTTYANPYIILAEQGPEAAALSDRSTSVLAELPNTGRQRGNSKNNDWYSFAGITLTVKLPGKHIPCFSYY